MQLIVTHQLPNNNSFKHLPNTTVQCLDIYQLSIASNKKPYILIKR